MYQKIIEMLFVHHTLYIEHATKDIGCAKIILKQFYVFIFAQVFSANIRLSQQKYLHSIRFMNMSTTKYQQQVAQLWQRDYTTHAPVGHFEAKF